MIRAVIFDLMGTLAVSTEKDDIAWVHHMHRLLADLGLEADEKQLLTAWDAFETGPSESGHTPFEEHIHRVALSLNLELSWDKVVAVADATCLRSESFLEIDPDAIALLEALKDRHTPLVTNYNHPPEVYRFLETLGLQQFLEPVIISGAIGIWKPDPQIITAALDAVGANPDEAVYVGDSHVDVEAALSAGVLPIVVARQDGYADPFRAPEDDIEKEFADLIDQSRVRVVRRLGEVAGLV